MTYELKPHNPDHPYSRRFVGCGHGVLYKDYCKDCEIVSLQSTYKSAIRQVQACRDGLRRLGVALPAQAQAVAITPPPIECNTEELKRAYAFGWWSALEKQRETAQAGTETLTKEQVESLLYKHGYDPDDEHMAEMLQAAVRLKRTPHAG